MTKAKRVSTQPMWNQREMQAVCAAARVAFHRHHRIPTVEEIDEVCREVSGVKLRRIFASEEFIGTLAKDGIQFKRAPGLSAKQNYMLMLITNPNDRRSFQDRLRDAKVSTTEYRAWMKDPLFAGLVNQFAEAAIGDHMANAHNALLKKVDSGDMRALEFYYALTGRYNPTSSVERDINSVLTAVLDIITRNVTDSTVLNNIAGELTALMSGPTKPVVTAGPANALEASFVDGVIVDPFDAAGYVDQQANDREEAVREQAYIDRAVASETVVNGPVAEKKTYEWMPEAMPEFKLGK